MTTRNGSSPFPGFAPRRCGVTRRLGRCPALAALLVWLGCGHDWSGPSGSDADAAGPDETAAGDEGPESRDAPDTDAAESEDAADVPEVPAYCGNGIVDPGEECDDGNGVAGDGCESDCAWTCVSDDECDDGQVCNGGEACRDHVCATDPGTMAPDGTPCATSDGGDGICRGGLCAGFACGNGFVDPGEECDDGDGDNTNGCLADCRRAYCGDGFVWAGVEQCEEGSVRACATACDTTGTQGCARCRWSSDCLPPAETCCNLIDDDCDGVTDGIEEGCCLRDQRVTYDIPAGTIGGPECIAASGGACTAVASCVAPGGRVEADRPPEESDCPSTAEHMGTLACTGPGGSAWFCRCTPLVECRDGRVVATGFTW